ncbi:ribosome-associated translation inhibitor RaiA [Alphaproteobacteria bacterium]|jgi:ribosomal subunit interface protein|nr:ribosome-associated translation inhibitor RaiA [Alphaproteobacteria bacterium]|tara:strand:- start:2810 stop:3409 length:600 start_codon:yes stop_codon:yes gene_type:complete
MTFKIFGKQVKLGDAFSDYAKLELNKSVEKYFKNSTSTIVSLSKQNKIFMINIIVHINKKMEFTSHSNGETAKVALNNGIEKLSKQLRRYKRKIKNHKVSEEKNNFNDLKAQLQIIDQTSSFPNQLEETKNEPLIFAEIDTEIEELSVIEAVQKMEYGNATALMFRNKKHSGLNMIYKRSDGLVGWVDPRGKRETINLK